MPDPDITMAGENLPPAPTLIRNLSRLHRFLGQTTVPWTVLQHVLAGDRVLQADNGAGPWLRTAWFLHDIEEALIGDIQWGFKTEQQRTFGENVRARILKEVFDLPLPSGAVKDRVDRLDDEMAAAEAEVLAHTSTRDRLAGHGFARASDLAVDAVWDLKDLSPRDAVSQALSEITDLLNTSQVRSLRGR